MSSGKTFNDTTTIDPGTSYKSLSIATTRNLYLMDPKNSKEKGQSYVALVDGIGNTLSIEKHVLEGTKGRNKENFTSGPGGRHVTFRKHK